MTSGPVLRGARVVLVVVLAAAGGVGAASAFGSDAQVEPLSAVDCAGGAMAVSDPIYPDEGPGGAPLPEPNLSLDAIAKRWLGGRPDIAVDPRGLAPVARPVILDDSHAVISVNGSATAQLVLERHAGAWRIERILECGR